MLCRPTELVPGASRGLPGSRARKGREEKIGEGAAGAESCSPSSEAEEECPTEGGRGGFGPH